MFPLSDSITVNDTPYRTGRIIVFTASQVIDTSGGGTAVDIEDIAQVVVNEVIQLQYRVAFIEFRTENGECTVCDVDHVAECRPGIFIYGPNLVDQVSGANRLVGNPAVGIAELTGIQG